MDVFEITTQLTLKAIECGCISASECEAEAIAKTFDTILKGVNKSIAELLNE